MFPIHRIFYEILPEHIRVFYHPLPVCWPF